MPKLRPASDEALKELPLKLRNEKRLNRKMRSIFNTIAKDVKNIMTITGVVPDIGHYAQQISEIIDSDSRITALKFKRQIRKKLKLGSVASQIIDSEIDQYISKTSFTQAAYIASTTQTKLELSAGKVIKKFAEQGIEPTRSDLGKATVISFKKTNRARTKTIAQTEIQRVSERVKIIEAKTLVRVEKIKKARKRWDAILDMKTRPAHALADSDIVDIDSPFTVMGELLMHPGDSSLGASIANLANCRCSVSYIAD